MSPISTEAAARPQRSPLRRCSPFLAGVAAALLLLPAALNDDPVIGDGLENLTLAYNLVNHRAFALNPAGSPPSMKREPLFPALCAAYLVLSPFRLRGLPLGELAADKSIHLKFVNIFLCALTIGMAAWIAHSLGRRSWVSALAVIVVGVVYLLTSPRLINRLNNDTLGMLMVVVSSYSLYSAWREGRADKAALAGALFGLLVVTKAQFMFIAPVLALAWARTSWRSAATFALVVFMVTAPWMARNVHQFGVAAIAGRGQTVASVRLKESTQLRGHEYACMAYAFSHPHLRGTAGHLLGLVPADFSRGNRCERLNREMCYDMGLEKVACRAFPEDLEAHRSGDPGRAVQLFHSAFVEGEAAEQAGRSVVPTYIKWNSLLAFASTAPLFLMRGLWFSELWFLSVMLSVALFVVAFDREFGPLTGVGLLSFGFNSALTHNIPRYHVAEVGVMLICLALTVERGLRRIRTITAKI